MKTSHKWKYIGDTGAGYRVWCKICGALSLSQTCDKPYIVVDRFTEHPESSFRSDGKCLTDKL